jgi:hypothetical protein
MRFATGGSLRNGFLVFGESPDEASLLKCGLRLARKKAVIVEGSLNGGKATEQPITLDESRVYDLDVTLEPSTDQVTMRIGQTTVTAALQRRPASICYIGYAASDAAADFSPIQVIELSFPGR